jgi:glycosyltransferase involved in cell wall biosynthesis
MISILLPIYNGIEFIDESVTSILSQTYNNWELLIGINGHEPNSKIYKIAKKYEEKCENGKIRVYDFFHIKSKCSTLNTLLRYAKYDWIALIDVDDIWHDNKLTVQNIFFDKFDVIGSRAVYFGEREGVVPPIPIKDISKLQFINGPNPIINSSAIIKKHLCNWNIEYEGIEDYEIWLRLKKEGKKFYNCEEILVKHRIHHNSAFNTKDHTNNFNKLKEIYGKYIGLF